MRERKQIIAIFLIGALALSMLSGTETEAKKKKKPKFNKTKITMKVGDKKSLKIKNSTSKKIKWSSSNKKVVSIAVSLRNCRLTGKKAGTSLITAKVGKVKLKCKVDVKAKSKTPDTPIMKNPTIPPTVTESAKSTANPALIENWESPKPTSTPTAAPTVKPAETPKVITTEDNFKALKKYIQEHGDTNSEGNKSINDSLLYKEAEFTYEIAYDSEEQKWEFIYTEEDAGFVHLLTMEISKHDIKNGNFIWTGRHKDVPTSGSGLANLLELNSLSENSLLNWTISVSGIMSTEDAYEFANLHYKAAYSSWELLLLRRCGLTMQDLGFDGGYVEANIPITGFDLSLAGGKDIVYPGGDTTVGVTYTPEETTQKELIWTSNNSQVTVNGEGKVTIPENFVFGGQSEVPVIITATSKSNPALTRRVTIMVCQLTLPTKPYELDFETMYDAELSGNLTVTKTTDSEGTKCWKFNLTGNSQRIYFRLPEEVNLSAYQKYEIVGFVPGQISLDFFDAKLPVTMAIDGTEWWKTASASTFPFYGGSYPNRLADGTPEGVNAKETQSDTLSSIKKTESTAGDYNRTKYIAIGSATGAGLKPGNYYIYSFKLIPKA